jgi:hypothetical protein
MDINYAIINENEKILDTFIQYKLMTLCSGHIFLKIENKIFNSQLLKNKILLFLKIFVQYVNEYISDIFKIKNIKYSILLKLKKLNIDYSNVLLSHIYLKNKKKENKFKYYFLKVKDIIYFPPEMINFNKYGYYILYKNDKYRFRFYRHVIKIIFFILKKINYNI